VSEVEPPVDQMPLLVEYDGRICATLRVVDDFGLKALDLIGPPRRCATSDDHEPLYMPNVDFRRIRPILTPAAQLDSASRTESWLTLTGRAQARLFAAFLLGEDPQRRLDSRKAAALMHQMSLVQHVMGSDNLRRVLIADEVGLGKTIEAGMIVRLVREQQPTARVLYLAPARLVRNVVNEFREKLDLDARSWVAGSQGDARLDGDRLVVASIHKAVFGENREKVLRSGPWDVIIVDECHHLSDWGDGGGKPNQNFKLVQALAEGLASDGRLILLSGTPHQGSINRFENLLRLLDHEGKRAEHAAGRVIYRTKERVRDWHGRPLFPAREIRAPRVVSMDPEFHSWYESIAALYDGAGKTGAAARAAGWAKGQALQWASSSYQAGIGYLVRLAMRRLRWTVDRPELARALEVMRPYRGGSDDESLATLFERIWRDIQPNADYLDDQEVVEGDDIWRPDAELLAATLDQGVRLARRATATSKWEALATLLKEAGSEKVVLFAQPVETVSVVVRFLAERFGEKAAIIIGNQNDSERMAEVNRFGRPDGPRFLVSSRAGGEGLNLQVARRLVHIDVPWNPMELEQRIGRVHRFGSRKTILVDTLVVQGTREVEMYRIAREKLRLIATHMDPEQFEQLFSRVMSLVPPKELEAILGDAAATRIVDEKAETIGALVRQGYSLWEKFDAKFRDQAERIRALEPGEARWSDLEAFLVRWANARRASDVKVLAFEHAGDEIIAREETATALRLEEGVFVCAETSGTPVEDESGNVVPTIGMNHDVVKKHFRDFVLSDGIGGGYVNRPASLGEAYPPQFGILAYLRHAIRLSPRETTERSLTFHAFIVDGNSVVRELAPNERAELARALHGASRVKDPQPGEVARAVRAREASTANDLRSLSDEERSEGGRPAVWPIAAFVVG
jgi:superfamily II DNA or RNA helicase